MSLQQAAGFGETSLAQEVHNGCSRHGLHLAIELHSAQAYLPAYILHTEVAVTQVGLNDCMQVLYKLLVAVGYLSCGYLLLGIGGIVIEILQHAPLSDEVVYASQEYLGMEGLGDV